MATRIQLRRGTGIQHGSFTGATGEVTVNTTNKSLHVHDGATAGGFESARADLSNASNVGVLTATTFDGNLTGTATTTTNIPNLSGDITSANTVTTLATVNSNVGTFGNGSNIPTITVNAKGLVTAVSTTAVDPANDGTLTLATSGTGLSGSATFTANDTDNVTFTVTSNATSANTGSTIVARDASGNFNAGIVTATSFSGSLTGNVTGSVTGNVTGNASTATTLQTARTINEVSFNGSANIVVEPYIEDDDSTNATRYIVFTDSSTAGYKRLNEDADLNYNPSTNTLVAGNFTSTSDINLKKDVEVISDAYEILSQIRGVRFSWIGNDMKSTGVIAQDVEQVLPELVAVSEKGTKSVNYQGLIGVLIEAVKDQQKQIDILKGKIESLKS